MSSCPGCSYPIHVTQILCARCIASDLAVRWPTCQQCHWYEACHQSAYELCTQCDYQKRVKQHTAALIIQDFFRDYLIRQDAATLIQAVWRGHSSRRGFVAPPPNCSHCRQEEATMINEYGDNEDVCADCFWDLREDYRRMSYLQRQARLEKLIH